MTVTMRAAAEADLEEAFAYYESVRPGLGRESVVEFRRAVDQIIRHPNAWQPLDSEYRRYRLHRFPYGVIYRINQVVQEIILVAVQQLNQRPDDWRRRLGPA
jgi:plasmid stabilization system protein ParE